MQRDISFGEIPDENWIKISDLDERRRIQNRIAQRDYRKKLKNRLQDLERRAVSSSASPDQRTSSTAATSTSDSDKLVMGPSEIDLQHSDTCEEIDSVRHQLRASSSVMQLKKLLANRGEIPLRIFRTAHELSLHTVAVYSHEERLAMARKRYEEQPAKVEETATDEALMPPDAPNSMEAAVTGLDRPSMQLPASAQFFEADVVGSSIRKHLDHAASTWDFRTQSSKTIYELPGILGMKYQVAALGDTGAKYNYIRKSYAAKLGLPIDRSSKCKVTITRDRSIETKGVTTALFRFAGETQAYLLEFHVLRDCPHDVVLGKQFLKATKTFTNFMHRVKKRVIQTLTEYNLMYLGESAPKFTGLLNGHPREALADSGAKGLFMDEDFALSMGLPILRGPRHEATVRFADKSTAITSGMVHGVKWEFGLSGAGREHILDFHVLKNAPANVILSDDFLFNTNAFVEYDRYLVDEDDEDDDAYFFAIDIERKSLDPSALAQASDFARYQETLRQGQEEDLIANLPRDQQPAARAIEEQRRAAWRSKYCSNPNTSSSSGEDNSAGSPSDTGGEDAHPGSEQSIPPDQNQSKKRPRWFFKLKKRKVQA